MRKTLHPVRQTALLALACALLGCGGLKGSGGPMLTGFYVTPRLVTLDAGQQKDFRARSDYAFTDVQWEMVEGAGAGTLSPYTSEGRFYVRYTAPTTPGTYSLKAPFTTPGPGPGIGYATITVR